MAAKEAGDLPGAYAILDAAIEAELEATRREIEMLRGNLRGELEQLPIGGAEMPRHGLAADDETHVPPADVSQGGPGAAIPEGVTPPRPVCLSAWHRLCLCTASPPPEPSAGMAWSCLSSR